MSDNLVLERLRAIRGDIAEVNGDVVEVKERFGLLQQQYSSISRRADRLGGDIEQIKCSLDLVSAT